MISNNFVFILLFYLFEVNRNLIYMSNILNNIVEKKYDFY